MTDVEIDEDFDLERFSSTYSCINTMEYDSSIIQPNQIYPQLMSTSSLNFSDGANSASRKQMFCSQIGQALVILGATERRIQTGAEQEYGKYTFGVRMPANGEIIKVIQRYPKTIGNNAISTNPQTIAIYEDAKTGEIGVVNLPGFSLQHQYFGFDYCMTSSYRLLREGEHIAKGTVFLDSPSVGPQGQYRYAAEVRLAMLTMPGTAEDAVTISRTAADTIFSYYTYETRSFEFGKHYVPVNLYPKEGRYGFCPDIGDVVRDDGIVAALRPYVQDGAAVQFSAKDLTEVDHIFDKKIYADGPGGEVIDIRIVKNDNEMKEGLPEGIGSQMDKYDHAKREFHRQILEMYRKLKRQRQDRLRLKPAFSRMVYTAMLFLKADQSTGTDKSPKLLYRSIGIDQYRVEIVIRYRKSATIGSKLTCEAGG